MRCRVGKGAPAHTEPQSRSTARAPCPRVRPVFTLSPDTWAQRHTRAFVTSPLWTGAFAHPTNDRTRAKPALVFVPPALGSRQMYILSTPDTDRDSVFISDGQGARLVKIEQS